MILVYVLTAWHAIAAGDLGRPLGTWPTRASCEHARRHSSTSRHEWLTCQPMRLPRSALGKPA